MPRVRRRGTYCIQVWRLERTVIEVFRASGDADYIAFKSEDLNEPHFSFFTLHLTTLFFFPFVDLIADLGGFFVIFFTDDFIEHGGEIIE